MQDQNLIIKTPFLSITEAEQLELLNRQISYARKNSRFYSARLEKTGTYSSFEELASVPFLTEEEIRAAGTSLVCVAGAEVERIVSVRTSGTKGPAKRIYFTKRDLERTQTFFEEGMGWMCRKGDSVAVLMPNSSPYGLSDLLAKALKDIGTIPVLYPVYEKDAEIMPEIIKQHPDVIVGYPWYVRILSLCYPELRPRVVLLSADYIPETLKELIQSRWGCRVLSHYGMTETGYGCAVEHPGGSGMYLRKQDLYAEIIDTETAQVLPAGQVGELVLTTLRREAMPLIRYRTGDYAVMNGDGTIAKVLGRLGQTREFYREQERMSPLTWLLDYQKTGNRLTAEVLNWAPADAEEILRKTGDCEKVELIYCPAETARPLIRGKRVEE